MRIVSSGSLGQSWMDAKLLRDDAGKVTGLLVNGGRVKRLELRRE